MGMPSRKMVAKARISAWPQSIAASVASRAARRRFRGRSSFGLGAKPSGNRSRAELISRSSWALTDLGVHHRLRERRLVTLVVAPAAVPDQVDQEVLPKTTAVGHGEPHSG